MSSAEQVGATPRKGSRSADGTTKRVADENRLLRPSELGGLVDRAEAPLGGSESCLSIDEVESLCEGEELPPERLEHARVCESCAIAVMESELDTPSDSTVKRLLRLNVPEKMHKSATPILGFMRLIAILMMVCLSAGYFIQLSELRDSSAQIRATSGEAERLRDASTKQQSTIESLRSNVVSLEARNAGLAEALEQLRPKAISVRKSNNAEQASELDLGARIDQMLERLKARADRTSAMRSRLESARRLAPPGLRDKEYIGAVLSHIELQLQRLLDEQSEADAEIEALTQKLPAVVYENR